MAPPRKQRGQPADYPHQKLTFGLDQICSKCKGKGSLHGQICNKCRGEGLIREVPRGVDPPS